MLYETCPTDEQTTQTNKHTNLGYIRQRRLFWHLFVERHKEEVRESGPKVSAVYLGHQRATPATSTAAAATPAHGTSLVVVGGGVGFPALWAEDFDRVVLWVHVLPQLMW